MLVSCSSQYKRISFDSETLGETLAEHIDENTEVVYKANDSFSEEFPIYRISKHKISDSEFKLMLKNLGLTEDDTRVKLDGNKITGTLASYTDTSRGYFNMSDEELEKLAWDTFNKLTFIEGSYEYLGIKSTDKISSSNAEHVTRVGVSFRRLIDGIRIVGNDQCYLYFDGSGLVEINAEVYDYEEVDTVEAIPLKTATESVKKPDSFSIKQNIGILKTLQVDKVKLLYVNQYREDCDMLQPVYNFIGTATDIEGNKEEFNSIVIAIPEKYTYTEEKSDSEIVPEYAG